MTKYDKISNQKLKKFQSLNNYRFNDMSFNCLYMLGIDHYQASVETRELFAFRQDEALVFADALIKTDLVKEVVILSTCNRTELYVVSPNNPELIKSWWLQTKSIDSAYKDYIIVRTEIDALRHLMKTASGLESMILGEPQVLGQVRSSYLEALEHGHISNHLNDFFEQGLIAAKAIRRGTDIGKCPVSVAFSAVHLAKNHYLDSLFDKSVLILGAGDTAKLVARHLYSMKTKRLLIANRSIERAKELALKVDAEYYSLDDLATLLDSVDLIVSAVDSGSYLIDSDMIQTLKIEKSQLLFIDLAVPRSIDPRVESHDFITLYGIDNLHKMIELNKNKRQKASHYAEHLIDQMIDQYQKKLRYRQAVHKIKALRQSTDQLAQNELEKSLKRLDNGNNPYDVLAELVHSLKNKWLHNPSISMRKAAANGEGQLLDNAYELFGLKED